MDQPRHVRVQAFEGERKRKESQEADRRDRQEKERQQMAAQQALTELNGRVAAAWQFVWEALARGDGDAAEVKRFDRRQELKLLVVRRPPAVVVRAYDSALPLRTASVGSRTASAAHA